MSLKVSRAKPENKNASNYKDRFKTEEPTKLIDATIKFKEHVFLEESKSPEEAIKKRDVFSSNLDRRLHHNEQEDKPLVSELISN